MWLLLLLLCVLLPTVCCAQGINRLGLMFTQFSIAAATVSIVTTLEAASKWPPLVTSPAGCSSRRLWAGAGPCGGCHVTIM